MERKIQILFKSWVMCDVMKLESIIVENYRQFDSAKLTFDEGVTILAGANNSGKTSLINLIKNIFVDEKTEYNMSDIPAGNMQEWIEDAYIVFRDFFTSEKLEEDIDRELIESFIPKDEALPKRLMKTTSVKIHVSYDPDNDDIKLFADYIMDLDDEKHDFYFLFTYEISKICLCALYCFPSLRFWQRLCLLSACKLIPHLSCGKIG